MGEKGNATAAAASTIGDHVSAVATDAAGIARDVAVGGATTAIGETVKGRIHDDDDPKTDAPDAH